MLKTPISIHRPLSKTPIPFHHPLLKSHYRLVLLIQYTLRKVVKEGVKKEVKMDNRYVYNIVAKCFVLFNFPFNYHFNFILYQFIEVPYIIIKVPDNIIGKSLAKGQSRRLVEDGEGSYMYAGHSHERQPLVSPPHYRDNLLDRCFDLILPSCCPRVYAVSLPVVSRYINGNPAPIAHNTEEEDRNPHLTERRSRKRKHT